MKEQIAELRKEIEAFNIDGAAAAGAVQAELPEQEGTGLGFV